MEEEYEEKEVKELEEEEDIQNCLSTVLGPVGI